MQGSQSKKAVYVPIPTKLMAATALQALTLD